MKLVAIMRSGKTLLFYFVSVCLLSVNTLCIPILFKYDKSSTGVGHFRRIPILGKLFAF